MPEVPLITQNPVIAGYNEAQEQRRRRQQAELAQQREQRFAEAHEFEMGEAQRQTQEGQAAAGAIGRHLTENAALNPDDPRAAFLGQLGRTGQAGAQQAFELHETARTRQVERENELERLAIEAAAAGDDITYRYASSQLKKPVLPPGWEDDVRTRAAWGRASMVAERMYEGSPQQAQQFTLRFIENGGNLVEAAQVVGAPVDKPNWTVETVIQNGQRAMAFVDSISGRVRMAQGPEGQPVQMPAPVGHAGGQAADIQKVEYLRGLGVPQETAVALVFASGLRTPQQAWAETYQAVYTARSRSGFGFNPEEADQAARGAADIVAGALNQQFGGGNSSGNRELELGGAAQRPALENLRPLQPPQVGRPTEPPVAGRYVPGQGVVWE